MDNSTKTLKYMKKIAWISVFEIVLVFTTIGCKFDGVRCFYCLSEDKCITVWKKGSDEVYIIPCKYEGNKTPDVSYLKTIDKQLLTLYFSEELPNKIIVRDGGNFVSNKKMYSIENKENNEWKFLEYSDKYKAILYKPDATKFKDVKSNANYLYVDIHENYATDKTGKKIEQYGN